MLEGEGYDSGDDAMSNNYHKDRLDNVSHLNWKKAKYGHKKLLMARQEDMNVM